MTPTQAEVLIVRLGGLLPGGFTQEMRESYAMRLAAYDYAVACIAFDKLVNEARDGRMPVWGVIRRVLDAERDRFNRQNAPRELPAPALDGRQIANSESGGEFCQACGNDGWVLLLGEVKIGGHTYSRGATACKWCAKGASVAQADPRLTSDYSLTDVDAYGPQHPKRASGKHVAALADQMRGVGRAAA